MGHDFGISDWSLQPPQIKPDTTGLLSRRELAACFNVDPQTVFKWERAGMPCALNSGPGRPSYFSEVDVRVWLEERADRPAIGERSDLDIARAQREHWQAKLAEQQFRSRSSELLDAEEVRDVWNAELIAVRSIVENAYARAGQRVASAAACHGVAGVEAELKAIAYEVLHELANEDRPIGPEVAPPQVPTVKLPALEVVGRDAFVAAATH